MTQTRNGQVRNLVADAQRRQPWGAPRSVDEPCGYGISAVFTLPNEAQCLKREPV